MTDWGSPDLALKNYNEGLQIYREIGDKQDIGVVLNNLAQFYDDRGKYNDALKLFKESLQIQREVHNQNNEALCLNNIGNTYLFKGDYEDARMYSTGPATAPKDQCPERRCHHSAQPC